MLGWLYRTRSEQGHGHFKMLTLSTPRLTIRPFVEGDAPAMAAVLGDTEVMRFSESGPLDEAEVSNWIDEQVKAYSLARYFGRWAICENAGSQAIGYVGLTQDEGRTAEREAESAQAIGYVKLTQEEGLTGAREAELGFRLARRSWGKGYATEVARAVVDDAFGAGRVERLIGIVDPHNVASVRVLQKLGMSYVRPISFEGYDYPDHLYVLDRPGL